MRDSEKNTLMMQIPVDEGELDFRSFINAMKDTFTILREIDADISKGGNLSLNWTLVSASLNSPLTITVRGKPVNGHIPATDIVVSMIRGMKYLDAHAAIPTHFSPTAVKAAENLVRRPGLGDLILKGPGTTSVTLTPRLAANAQIILRPSHREHGTIEGMLDTISVHKEKHFVIYHPITSEPTKCSFPPLLLDKAKRYLGSRVAATGPIRYNRAGNAVKMTVEQLRRMRQGHKPLARAIDVTGDEDAARYVRGLRNAED